jgi:long-chain acyl-CoA synthetase
VRDPHDWQSAYPRGLGREFEPPDRPLWRFLADAADAAPDAAAVHWRDVTLSYAELRSQALAAAERMDAGPGDRVLLVLPNCPEFVSAYYGALRSGATVVAASPHLRPREIQQLARHVEPVVTVAAGEGFASAGRFLDVKPGAGFGAPPARPSPAAHVRPARDVAVLQYTSGTTGGLKAAMMSHRNLVANALQNDAWFRWTADDVVLGALPLCHTWGMCCVMNAALAAGASMALVDAFDAEETLEVVRRRRVTVVYGSATMFHRLLDAAGDDAPRWFGSVRYVKAGAMLVGADLPRRWAAAVPEVPMVNGYGLTEASPEVANNPPHAPRPGTVGVPLPGTELRICDPADPEIECPEGEIQVRGPQVMLGYWRDPEATRDALSADGWLRTGDVGRFDEAGYLVVVDRLKDLIKFRGYSVVPAVVERALLEHADVAEACVVGRTDSVDGEVPVAFVRLHPDAAATEADLSRHADERLARYEVPRAFLFVDEIPKNAVGKPLRRELRASLGE